MAFDGNAEKTCAPFVLADRDHGAAERRAQDEGHDADRQRKTEQHEVVKIVGAGEDVDLEGAEIERLAGEAAQAVIAAGQRAPLEGDVVEHLAERDRHHGEIDTAPPHDQGAEDGAAEAAQQHSQDQRQRRAERDEFQRQSGAVGAEAEIGGMTERQHAGKSKQEIQRHRR